jgi:hypothetical protein
MLILPLTISAKYQVGDIYRVVYDESLRGSSSLINMVKTLSASRVLETNMRDHSGVGIMWFLCWSGSFTETLVPLDSELAFVVSETVLRQYTLPRILIIA